MLSVGHGPTLPMQLAWPELAVAMETPCVATSIRLASVIICVCVFIYAGGNEKQAQLVL